MRRAAKPRKPAELAAKLAIELADEHLLSFSVAGENVVARFPGGWMVVACHNCSTPAGLRRTVASLKALVAR